MGFSLLRQWEQDEFRLIDLDSSFQSGVEMV